MFAPKERGAVLSLCALWLSLAASAAPLETWVPVGPPPWPNTLFQTAGGITYFTHTSRLPVCNRVTVGPVTRNGTNLTQTITQEHWTGICVDCVCYCLETHVTVLGVLPPANYTLNVDSWNPTFRMNDLLTRLTFTVSSPVTPMLSAFVDTNRATFNLSVAGVPNVQYVIQASANLTNWTAIATNNGGPFVFSEPISAQPTNRFYRAVFHEHSVVSDLD